MGEANRFGRAVRRSVIISLVVLPLAALALVFGVAVALLIETPGEGLAPHAWRVLAGDAGNGVWVALAAGAAALYFALRPVSRVAIERWIRRRDLSESVGSDAAAELRRIRIWRTMPTVLGAYLGVGPVLAADLSVALRGIAHPLSEASNSRVYPALIFVGYLAGTVLAEATRRRPRPASSRGARLDTRRPIGYLTARARALPILVAGAILATLGVRALLLASPEVARGATDVAAGLGTLPVVVLAVALALGVPALQRWLVQRRQPVGDPDSLALDDELRSSAAHAVVGVCCAGGLTAAADLLGDVWSAAVLAGAGGLLRWPLVVVGTGLGIATVGVWLGYGSGHVGVRPRRGSPVA